MLERLLENWLDNVGERSYQAAFCQLLAAQGHRVVHSTRHMPFEFGKDVISISPEGVPQAYQLKGNPGARLTLAQFREIAPQLHELVVQKIVYPGLPDQPHESYLVTNGYVEEEVHRAVDDFNRRLDGLGIPPAQRLKLISRGDILRWLDDHGSSIWPIDVSPMHSFLNILVLKGEEVFPIVEFEEIQKGILGLGTKKTIKSAAELKRRVYSAAVMTAVSLTNFEQQKNHYAKICAWTLFVAYVNGACSRYDFSFKNVKEAVDLARITIKDNLCDMAREVIENCENIRTGQPDKSMFDVYRMSLTVHKGLADFMIYPGRLVLVSALMSLFWFWCEKDGWPESLSKDEFEDNFPVPVKGMEVWGEAAVPQLLIHFWHWRANDPTNQPDHVFRHLLNRVLSGAGWPSEKGMPSPYYSYEDVISHRYATLIDADSDRLERECFKNTSFVAQGLLHLLVRTNRKTECKLLWADFSRFLHMEFIPKKAWQFCLTKSEEGKNIGVQPVPTKKWEELKDEARHVDCKHVPASFATDPHVLMAFVIISPNRLTTEVTRYLGFMFNDVWFLDDPIAGKGANG